MNADSYWLKLKPCFWAAQITFDNIRSYDENHAGKMPRQITTKMMADLCWI
jgi:hypothetical protein